MPQGQKNTWKRKYKTAAELQEKCDEYFAKCDEEGKLYGEAGLALHLGVKLDTLRKWYDGKDCSSSPWDCIYSCSPSREATTSSSMPITP